jgi:uncharacterized protein (DUF4415 family)
MAERTKKAKRVYGVPDEDTPELTEEMLKRAITFPELLRRLGKKPLGRPPAELVKTPVNLRLDPEIIDHFKAGWPGWQTRINAVLSKYVKAANSNSARKRKAS